MAFFEPLFCLCVCLSPFFSTCSSNLLLDPTSPSLQLLIPFGFSGGESTCVLYNNEGNRMISLFLHYWWVFAVVHEREREREVLKTGRPMNERKVSVVFNWISRNSIHLQFLPPLDSLVDPESIHSTSYFFFPSFRFLWFSWVFRLFFVCRLVLLLWKRNSLTWMILFGREILDWKRIWTDGLQGDIILITCTSLLLCSMYWHPSCPSRV